MSTDMPQRPVNHTQETWSSRAFAGLLPRDWLIHDQSADYGIDHRVEIFTDGHATGMEFNVQLKSTRRGSGTNPAVAIERPTLNYLEALASPTLVVIAHDPSNTLWYQWVHLLAEDLRPDSKKRQVRSESVLTTEVTPVLAEEVKAYRRARELTKHLPIDVSITGSRFYGQGSVPLRAAIGRLLAPLPSFVAVEHGTPRLPYFFVRIEDEKTEVGLRGSGSRTLTWGLHGDRDYHQLASDVVAALAFEAAAVGAEDLCVRLLKIAAPASGMLLDAKAFGYAIAALTRHGEARTVLELARKTVCVEDSPAGAMATAAFLSEATHSDPDLRRSVAVLLRDAAREWRSPGSGVYNAGAMLGDADSSLTLEMFEEAAAADPRYLRRPYWWRQKGTLHWNLHQTDEAKKSYRQAIALGETSARALLADVLLRTGQYREAKDEFSQAPIWEDRRHAQWRLSAYAAHYITEGFGFESQARDVSAWPMFEPAEDRDLEQQAIKAIHDDPLNGWAHSTLSGIFRDRKEPFLFPAITAAVTVNVDSFLWLALLEAALNTRELDENQLAQISHDAMYCAWTYCGSDFVETVLGIEQIDEGLRQSVIDFFANVRPDSDPLELRLFGGDGDGDGYESVFIPQSRPE